MIDIHSHVLPGIDDGSQSIEMSKEMLDQSAAIGVKLMVATPHFYADRMQLSSFLVNRENAYQKVAAYAAYKGIRLLRGAEVAFFRGIGKSEGISALRIEGTKLLLLEMPFREWTAQDLAEIDQLIERGIIPVIAHIERFFGFQKDRHIIDDLMDKSVLIQINADPLTRLFTRPKLLKLIQENRVHFLGSDCHNNTLRPQDLAKGRDVIRKKLGEDVLKQLDMTSSNMLEFSRV